MDILRFLNDKSPDGLRAVCLREHGHASEPPRGPLALQPSVQASLPGAHAQTWTQVRLSALFTISKVRNGRDGFPQAGGQTHKSAPCRGVRPAVPRTNGTQRRGSTSSVCCSVKSARPKVPHVVGFIRMTFWKRRSGMDGNGSVAASGWRTGKEVTAEVTRGTFAELEPLRAALHCQPAELGTTSNRRCCVQSKC